MEREILLFLKRWLINQGDCRPKEKIDSFLFDEFDADERKDTIIFVNQLINEKWMQQIIKDGREYIAISGYGAEMLKKIT